MKCKFEREHFWKEERDEENNFQDNSLRKRGRRTFCDDNVSSKIQFFEKKPFSGQKKYLNFFIRLRLIILLFSNFLETLS